MHTTLRLALAATALAAALPAAAQTPPAPEKPRSQVPTLGRPTKPDDPAPLLDFGAYFKGTWGVTWDYPESPLGAADVLTGKTTYTEKSPTTFEAVTRASTLDGDVTITEVYDYQREAKTITRSVTDSRGWKFTQKGTVAGDLGGQFTIRLDGEPFTHKGQTLRMNSIMRLLSPFNFRVQSNLSVDGGPFTNFGNPWWKKEGTSR
jgi:hypothetical protein